MFEIRGAKVPPYKRLRARFLSWVYQAAAEPSFVKQFIHERKTIFLVISQQITVFSVRNIQIIANGILRLTI